MNATISLREAVCESANLSRAYARFQRYRGLWVPGVPMAEVAACPVRHVLQLAEELRSGRYRPGRPHSITIAKGDGGRREILVYMLRDRVAQRALLQVMQGRTDGRMSLNSFGYRPGRSVAGAVERVRAYLDTGHMWVVDADIERCFDSIPREPLLTEVRHRLADAAAEELIVDFLGWDSTAQRTAVGIPQGSVLAPWLCNVYLWRLDEHMDHSGIPIVRFADDFVLLALTKSLAEGARRVCSEMLDALRLRLHPLKTQLVNAVTPFRFLGQPLAATRRLEWKPAAG